MSREELGIASTLGYGVIARVELGRQALRYVEALYIMRAVQGSDFWAKIAPINPLWLGEGKGPETLGWPLYLPYPSVLGLPHQISFSKFISMHRNVLITLVQDPPAGHLPAAWLDPFLGHLVELMRNEQLMFVAIGKAESLFTRSLEHHISADPEAPRLLKEYQELTGKKVKNNLTESSEFRKKAAMQSEIESLLDEVRGMTAAKGMKAKLASDLDVPKPRVSEWLAGKYEPSGEITLRLLRWVERRRTTQTEGPESAITPSEPKTPMKGRPNENPKSGPKQR